MNNTNGGVVFLISFCAWLWSLFLPGFIDNLGKVHLGWGILLSGWLGVLALNFAWYANAALAFSLVNVLRRNYKSVLYGSVIAVALGLTSVGVYLGMPTDFEGAAGSAYLDVGWAIWMLSLVVPGVFAYRELGKLQEQERLSLKKIATIFILVFSSGMAGVILKSLFNLLPLV